MLSCYFCGVEIVTDLDLHHPNKSRFPDWIEPAHRECHHRYHLDNGHFKEWGSWSPYAGIEGYRRVMQKYPTWHSMGGKMRARTARRRADGRFLPNGG